MSRDVGQAVEVQFPLQQLEPGWPPTTVEAIWCLPTPDEDGHFRVTNVPIHVIGVSRDDVVRARRGAAGPMEFVEVTARGGRSTLRDVFRDACGNLHPSVPLEVDWTELPPGEPFVGNTIDGCAFRVHSRVG